MTRKPARLRYSRGNRFTSLYYPDRSLDRMVRKDFREQTVTTTSNNPLSENRLHINIICHEYSQNKGKFHVGDWKKVKKIADNSMIPTLHGDRPAN